VTFEKDASIVWPQHAGDDLHGGGFAGAVGAQKADNFAGCDLEGDVLDGGDGAEAAAEVFDFKQDSPPDRERNQNDYALAYPM